MHKRRGAGGRFNNFYDVFHSLHAKQRVFGMGVDMTPGVYSK